MKKLLKGLGLAAAIAGLAAFFLGTKKGQELTKKAMTKTENMLDEIKNKATDALELTEEKYREISEAVVKRYEDAKEASADEIIEARSRASELWENIKEKGRDALKKNDDRA